MRNFNDLSQEEQNIHQYWMSKAIEQAKLAQAMGEVPIGAIIVRDGEILGQAYNQRECTHQAVAHAEILAIQAANQTSQAWRLEGASLYVTLEPCPMCAGAIINARIKEVIYGAQDPKAGCVGSLYNLPEDERFNHRIQVIAGACADETAVLLSEFFQNLRNKRKKEKLINKQKGLSTEF
ncbi:tRNA adenosine(34) deaminase TadA [Ignavigranum ruoffiae]|uniref:tRNA adenosine(34) deaminase TadA n=1 Tax=Ignavigranum ruoffiae TaxID=89093 RepID=UPI0020651892|nr:tRNA adenosine(34) deaminase TadA [Ignavigranum ruoffiae]UPQ86492.1 tRNA adenosine(34) deaminase TadA [Ignavigranum ruoffiae]